MKGLEESGGDGKRYRDAQDTLETFLERQEEYWKVLTWPSWLKFVIRILLISILMPARGRQRI